MDIPKTQTISLSDAERFCIGLKMLAEECNLSEISYIPLGIKTFIFKDGSKVGGLGAFMSAGLIKGV